MRRVIAIVLLVGCGGYNPDLDIDHNLDTYIEGVDNSVVFEHGTSYMSDVDRQHWLTGILDAVDLHPEVKSSLYIEFIRDENWPAPGVRGYYTPKLNRVRIRVFEFACTTQTTVIHELLHAKYCNMIVLEGDERMCEHPIEVFSEQNGEVAHLNYGLGAPCLDYQ